MEIRYSLSYYNTSHLFYGYVAHSADQRSEEGLGFDEARRTYFGSNGDKETRLFIPARRYRLLRYCFFNSWWTSISLVSMSGDGQPMLLD